jgi:hypothetical protein
MKKRIWIPSIIILVVCLLLILLKPTQHQNATLPVQTAAPTNLPSQTTQLKSAKHQQVAHIEEILALPPNATSLAKAIAETNPIIARELAQWQALIEFYGKVIDENSNPVPGASITFKWPEIPAPDGNRTATTESDTDGLFSLHDKRGPSLEIWVSKDGYYSPHGGQWGFNYALGPDIISPDPRNPIIFQLHKKGRGVELITSEHGMQLKVDADVPRDNTPVWVDFFQKQTSATGQLEISQNKPQWQTATNWSFSLSIPDGGLVENQDEFQFEAPETGYQPTVEFDFTKGETNWTTQVTKQFYIVFGQPQKYGWLRIESNLAQETVFLTYAINPTGSRNLEPK